MATTHADAIDSVINRFLNNLPVIDSQPFTADRVFTPNQTFNTPKNKMWVRLTTQFATSVSIQASINGISTVPSILTIDIFNVKGTGNKLTNQMLSHIISLYKREKFDMVRSTEVRVTDLGTDESWYHTQVDISFEFETCE